MDEAGCSKSSKLKMDRKKRKKQSSPESSKAVEEKKIKSVKEGISNEKPSLQPSQSIISPPEGKPVKPIFASASIKDVKNLISRGKFSSKIICKIKESNFTQISCYDINDKTAMIRELKSRNIGYHTYSEKSEKSAKYIVKGFYDTSSNDLLKMLKNEKVPAIKVSDFIRKEDYVMYLVHFDNSVDLEFLNQNHRVLDGVMIRWEKLKKKKTDLTQCYKCQAWGHASDGCGYPDRCVKCNDSHPKGQCLRVVRDDKVVCCNCGGNHSANHRGCSAYKKYADIISLRAKKKASSTIKSIEITSSQFPKLPKIKINSVEPSTSSELAASQLTNHITYAEKLQDAIKTENLYKKLTNAQDKLRRIPDIEKTIDDFCKFVDELAEVPNNNSARFSFLLKYNVARTESDNDSSPEDENMEEEYEITKHDEDTYVKTKTTNGEEWYTFGLIENLNEIEKLKILK